MSDVLLEVQDLNVSFQTFDGEARVLNGVNLSVRRGEAVAIVGESGCGKTVTVKAIMGLLPEGSSRIGSGLIRFKGNDLLGLRSADWSRIRGHQISMVFQDPMTHLNPVFSVGDQLTDVLLWSGQQRVGLVRWLLGSLQRGKRNEARKRAAEWLQRVRLPDPEGALARYPVELSGGMRQRVLIALGLITEPDLLIADEPGTALDVSIQDQILELLEDLVATQGTSLLFITHNLGVARRISQRIYVMYAGEVVETGSTQEVFDHPRHPYTQGLLASIPKLTGEMGEGIAGRIPNFVAPPPGCRFAPRCPFHTDQCDVQQPPLVEVAPGHQVACTLYEEGASGQ